MSTGSRLRWVILIALAAVGLGLAWRAWRVTGGVSGGDARRASIQPPPDVAEIRGSAMPNDPSGTGGAAAVGAIVEAMKAAKWPEGVEEGRRQGAVEAVQALQAAVYQSDIDAFKAAKRSMGIAMEPLLASEEFQKYWLESARDFAKLRFDASRIEVRWVEIDPKRTVGTTPRVGEAIGERPTLPGVSRILDRINQTKHRALEVRYPVESRDKRTGATVGVWVGYRLVWDEQNRTWIVRSAVTWSPTNSVVADLPF